MCLHGLYIQHLKLGVHQTECFMITIIHTVSFVSEPSSLTDDSTITGPIRLKSYYTIATYSDPKTEFRLSEGAVVSVLQKDASGIYVEQ